MMFEADAEKTMEDPLDDSTRVRYLQPGDFTLERQPGGNLRLTIEGERSVLRIKAHRCFPYAMPHKYISLRDGKGEEIGIITDLKKLPSDYQRWIEEVLNLRYYSPQVRSINNIRYRRGGIEWRVETDRGYRRFITRGVHDTMSEVEPGRYIITDVDGNRFELLTEKLDAPSKALLERLM